MSPYKTLNSFYESLLKTTLLAVAFVLLLAPTAKVQNANWQELKTHKLFIFDLDCAEKSAFPQKALGEIVRKEVSTGDGRRDQTYGDLAVAVKLEEVGPTVFFVPIGCGEKDCRWMLYTINPVKSLGEINGDAIITYHSARGMPLIIAVGAVDSFTSGYSTYSFDSQSGKYKWLGDKHAYVFDKKVKAPRPEGELPDFLRKPPVLMPQCKNMIQ